MDARRLTALASFSQPGTGEIIEPGGVRPGITGRTGEPILRSPEWGRHHIGRGVSPGGKPGSASGAALSGLGSVFVIPLLGAHAPSFTMSPLRGCEDRPVE